MQVLDARPFGSESRFNLLARAMRTLVDLLHTEHGYARIFYDQEGYSYELHSYGQTPMADLFTRMLGFASAADAAEAARQILTATNGSRRGQNNRRGRTRKPRLMRPQAAQLLLPVGPG